MINVDASELKARADDLIEMIGRGEVVAIRRDGRPFATMVPVRSDEAESVPDSVRDALDRLREMRKAGPRLSADEILALIAEGRRS